MKPSLIFAHLTNKLDGHQVIFLGNNEFQEFNSGNVPTNYCINEDLLGDSLQNILNMYLSIEQKHWEESGKPSNHIYCDLINLKNILL